MLDYHTTEEPDGIAWENAWGDPFEYDPPTPEEVEEERRERAQRILGQAEHHSRGWRRPTARKPR